MSGNLWWRFKNLSTRKCNEQVRFRDYSESMSETGDTSKFYKIRRILGQRQGQNAIEYFVQFKGEPAQNAIWIPSSIQILSKTKMNEIGKICTKEM
jgi:hypothetical protein